MHRGFIALTCALWLIVNGVQCGAAGAEPEVRLQHGDSWRLEFPTYHVQGLCVTEVSFWLSSVDRATQSGWVFRVDRGTLSVEASRRLADGPRYHPGGMQLVAGNLWVPLAEYRPHSTSVVLRLDPATLETRATFPVADHIGAIAADAQGTIYAGNWDCRIIYLFDEQGAPKEKRTNPTGVAYQDFEWHAGRIWATGAVRQENQPVGVVDVIDPADWRLERRFTLAARDPPPKNFGREGFSKLGENLFVVPDDFPNTTIYGFPIPKTIPIDRPPR